MRKDLRSHVSRPHLGFPDRLLKPGLNENNLPFCAKRRCSPINLGHETACGPERLPYAESHGEIHGRGVRVTNLTSTFSCTLPSNPRSLDRERRKHSAAPAQPDIERPRRCAFRRDPKRGQRRDAPSLPVPVARPEYRPKPKILSPRVRIGRQSS